MVVFVVFFGGGLGEVWLEQLSLYLLCTCLYSYVFMYVVLTNKKYIYVLSKKNSALLTLFSYWFSREDILKAWKWETSK